MFNTQMKWSSGGAEECEQWRSRDSASSVRRAQSRATMAWQRHMLFKLELSFQIRVYGYSD